METHKHLCAYPLERFKADWVLYSQAGGRMPGTICKEIKRVILSRVKAHLTKEELSEYIAAPGMAQYLPLEVGLWPAQIFPDKEAQ